MFRNVNLKDELLRHRGLETETEATQVVHEAFAVLYEGYCEDERVKKALGQNDSVQNEFSWAKLDAERIFSIDEIRKTAIQHRLRFLDTSKFKGKIPYEAMMEIKRLEKVTGTELKNYKIIAPGELFELEDCDKDPVLFLQLSDRYYYFIHQWGNDLSWYRKALMWPLRSFATLGATIAVVSFLLAMMVPTELLVGPEVSATVFPRIALFFWCLVGITSIVTYIGFAFFKNVSVNQWDSPFFKQEF